MAPNTGGDLLIFHRRVQSVFGGEKRSANRRREKAFYL
jgi:hypothetical protein